MYASGLMRALAQRGHEVHGVAVERVLRGAPACTAGTTCEAGCAIDRLDVTLSPDASFVLLAEHAPAEAWFDALLVRFRPDVVHLHSGYLLGIVTIRAAHRAGVPVVLTLHDYWFACPRVTRLHPSGEVCSGAETPAKCAWCLSSDQRRFRLADRLTGGRLSAAKDASLIWRAFMGGPVDGVRARQQATRDALESVSIVLAPSRFVAAAVAGESYPLERMRLSRYGIPSPAVRQPVPNQRLRIAYFGQLAPHKGVHLVVEAVRALPGHDLALTVHGPLGAHPEYVARLQRLADGDPRICFAGPYQREALARLYDETDVVVVPSVWHEVAALVIQEALSAGIPVVVSTLGGSPEFVHDGVNGLLFDVARPGALVEAFRRLLDDPTLVARLAAGCQPARTVDAEVDALVEAYASLCSPP